MALRDFTDAAGRAWTVWSVRPTSDLRLRSTPTSGSDPDRYEMLRQGWLVFEADGERRRFAPIPDDWEAIEPAALEALCRRAARVPTRRRPIE